MADPSGELSNWPAHLRTVSDVNTSGCTAGNGRQVAGTDWLSEARCHDRETEIFFVRGASKARRAQNICDHCTVRDECLEYAMEQDIEFGVWGGLTERQRRSLGRRLNVTSVAS
jgi:WhiB family redox-sensing transcriptional regulator